MFCSKCGAVVTGKYCSCCGQRARSEIEEFDVIERRLRRAFREECSKKLPCGGFALADACWLAVSIKYKKDPRDGYSFIEAENSLCSMKHAARALFDKLKDF